MNRTALVRLALVLGVCVAVAPHARAIDPLVTNFGLGHILHPLQEPQSIAVPSWCDSLPCHKEHVYIFAVNGINPLCTGNFNGLCGYLRKQGFEHTYFGQLYTSFDYGARIRDVRRCDPEARVVLIGFSLGANYVKAIANNLNKDCVKVDLLVYLVGDTVWNTPSSYPANVCRILNIRAKGLVLTGGDLFFNGAEIDGARNCHLECRHILAPSRCETMELLMQELVPLGCMACGQHEAVMPPITITRDR